MSVALQAVACELMKSIQARLLVDTMGYIRKNCNESFHRLFERASSIAAENDIIVTKPRTTGRQRPTANAAAETIEEHFKISFLNPFIDRSISHLNTRFPEEIESMLFGFYLMIS